MLDCGFGSFDSLEALRPDVKLDAILLSHAHADHVADLETFLLASARWRAGPRVVSSRSTLDSASFDERALGAASVELVRDGAHLVAEGFEAELSSTNHQIPTLGVQITMDGARVVYSADTGPEWAFPTTFRAPELAIVECTYEARDVASPPFHLDAREVATLVSDLSPTRTLLTHVPPGEDGDQRRNLVQRWAPSTKVILARTGMTVALRGDGSL